MNWNNVEPPVSGQPVLIKLVSGEVHEGHYIGKGNKYVGPIRRYRIYKYGKKTFAEEDVAGWCPLPE